MLSVLRHRRYRPSPDYRTTRRPFFAATGDVPQRCRLRPASAPAAPNRHQTRRTNGWISSAPNALPTNVRVVEPLPAMPVRANGAMRDGDLSS